MTIAAQATWTRPRRVDGRRLLEHIERLRHIGNSAAAGVTRLAFTPDDVRGRDAVAAMMGRAGLTVRVDEAANLIGERPGRRPDLPYLVLGSHLDTVPAGGHLDGAYGVLAAVEALHTVREIGVRPEHPVRVVAFSNEEGTRGTAPMFGSRAVAGRIEPGELAAPLTGGAPVLATEVDAAGGCAEHIALARWAPGSVAAYLELHIEQGPELERERVTIGVVEGITARLTIEVTVRGQSRHGGTTPMDHRRDALVSAAEVIKAVQDLATSGVVRVATVGECRVQPNTWNVVPGEVRLVVDVRDLSDARVHGALARVREVTHEVARRHGTAITVEPLQRVPVTHCDPGLRQYVTEQSTRLGLPWRPIASGAGHDAQWMAGLGPTAMIFVPSHAGLSHAPQEHTAPQDLVSGADVLLNTLLAADRALHSSPGTAEATT